MPYVAGALRRILLALLLICAASLPARAQDLTIFAAASLKTALDEIAQGWSKATGKPLPRLSYAASGVLAKQVAQGAPADLFLSADLDWMDDLAGRGLVVTQSRVSLLANRLVLIAPAGSKREAKLAPGVDLGALLGRDGRLAIGNVDSVPAGRYGRAALTALGAWDGVRDRLAQAENVRVALLLVARGEAPLGIVYSTDAAAAPGVEVVATFPPEIHPPIIYPAARLTDATSPDADAFLAHLQGRAARAVFETQGFTVLSKGAGPS